MILKCMENIYLVAISHESLIKMGGGCNLAQVDSSHPQASLVPQDLD